LDGKAYATQNIVKFKKLILLGLFSTNNIIVPVVFYYDFKNSIYSLGEKTS
jgi:hypothetical protein